MYPLQNDLLHYSTYFCYSLLVLWQRFCYYFIFESTNKNIQKSTRKNDFLGSYFISSLNCNTSMLCLYVDMSHMNIPFSVPWYFYLEFYVLEFQTFFILHFIMNICWLSFIFFMFSFYFHNFYWLLWCFSLGTNICMYPV